MMRVYFTSGWFITSRYIKYCYWISTISKNITKRMKKGFHFFCTFLTNRRWFWSPEIPESVTSETENRPWSVRSRAGRKVNLEINDAWSILFVFYFLRFSASLPSPRPVNGTRHQLDKRIFPWNNTLDSSIFSFDSSTIRTFHWSFGIFN